MDGRSTLQSIGGLALRRQPDEHLLERTFSGDPVALGELFRRHRSRIYGYCLARLMDPRAAEDATQEAFLRVLRARDTEVRDAKAWLFAVVRNTVADILRQRQATQEAPEDLDSFLHPTSGRDAAADFLGRQVARNVFTAIRRLPPRQRTALILRGLHHRSSEDIAQALATTPGNVDVLVSRARDAFGAAYADIAELPEQCRIAVETIYREQGSGITAHDRAAMRSHLGSCPSCESEHRRAHSRRYLPSILPFLIPPAHSGDGMLSRAALWARSIPDSLLAQAERLDPSNWSTILKVGAATAALAVAVSPALVDSRHPSPLSAGAPTLESSGVPQPDPATLPARTLSSPGEGVLRGVQEWSTQGGAAMHEGSASANAGHESRAHVEPMTDAHDSPDMRAATAGQPADSTSTWRDHFGSVTETSRRTTPREPTSGTSAEPDPETGPDGHGSRDGAH